MAKKRILDLVPIWKDKGINRDLKMKLVRSLVWTVFTYGAEGWTLKKADEKKDRIRRTVDLSSDVTSQLD